MLSICVTIKNRSRVKVDDLELWLFPESVDSMVESVGQQGDCELVVADWESNDWPLAEWLEETADPIPVRHVSLKGPFSRGRGRNEAARRAQGDRLVFLDADTLVCPALFERGMKHLSAGHAYFPILFSFRGPEHVSGWWRRTGYGNCMLTRETFERAGAWPDYKTWGWEDKHFHQQVRNVCHVVREEVPGFFHQWHPDDREWLDRFVPDGSG